MEAADGSQSARKGRFFGRQRLRLDAKGRLTFPALFRRLLGEDEEPLFVLRQGREGYVQLIPHEHWARLQDELEERSRREIDALLDAHERGELGDDEFDARLARIEDDKRERHVEVVPAPLDPKGRFAVDDELRERNGMGKELLVLGLGRYLELVDPDRYFAEREERGAGRSRRMDALLAR